MMKMNELILHIPIYCHSLFTYKLYNCIKIKLITLLKSSDLQYSITKFCVKEKGT